MDGDQTPASAEEPKIIIDEDWKEKVRRENAELEQQAAAGKEPAKPEPRREKLTDEQLPPPDFSTLVTMFATQAMMALGMFPHPATGQSEVELPLARHFIELLNVLEAKTKGNLDPDEARGLEENLHHLRMAFIEVTRHGAK